MDMSVAQIYYLARTACKKLSAEESRREGSLRLLISHGNLVDSIMKQILLTVEEHKPWFHQSAIDIVTASDEPAHITEAYTDFLRSWKDRVLESANSIESDLQSDSDSDTDLDSDSEFGANLDCNMSETMGTTIFDSTSGSSTFLYPFVATTTEFLDESAHSVKGGVSKISPPRSRKKSSRI